jgi:hypothetical protein
MIELFLLHKINKEGIKLGFVLAHKAGIDRIQTL